MPTALPAASAFTGASVSEGDFKTAITSLRDYLSGLLGTTGNVVDALAALMSVQQVLPISASVASNALTLTLSPCVLQFRSATLSSGAVSTRVVSSPVTLTVPTGATLGTANGVAARLAVYAMDNAGTVELAVVNSNGMAADESMRMTTSAISAAATSATTTYSTTARTSLPMRLLGYLDATQATAGTWATAPTLVQGAGGTVLATPSGAVGFFAMATPPTGWIKANGAAVSRTAYAALFAAIGTTYGTGDGSTTFNVPDLRGEFVRGWDDSRGVDSGRVIGSTQSGQIQSHVHTLPVNTSGGASYGNSAAPGLNTSDSSLSVASTGGNETRPRNLALLACIKF